jgi:hypothetical protein
MPNSRSWTTVNPLRRAGLAAVVALAACAAPPTPVLLPAPAPTPPAMSDMCYLVAAEAAKAPGLDVDRAPEVVKYAPKPLQAPRGGYPRGVIRRDGTTKVKVSVVVDTTGKADMSSFTVIETTHPWLAANLKGLIPRWSFTPAVKNGCQVAALWVFTASPGAPKRR